MGEGLLPELNKQEPPSAGWSHRKLKTARQVRALQEITLGHAFSGEREGHWILVPNVEHTCVTPSSLLFGNAKGLSTNESVSHLYESLSTIIRSVPKSSVMSCIIRCVEITRPLHQHVTPTRPHIDWRWGFCKKRAVGKFPKAHLVYVDRVRQTISL